MRHRIAARELTFVTPLAIAGEIEHHGLSVSRWIGRALFAARAFLATAWLYERQTKRALVPWTFTMLGTLMRR